MLIDASTNVTRTCIYANWTTTSKRPGTFSSAFFTVIGHASQVIPWTFNVTVLGAAHAEAVKTSMANTVAMEIFRFFIAIPSFRDLVEKLDYVRKHQGNQNQP